MSFARRFRRLENPSDLALGDMATAVLYQCSHLGISAQVSKGPLGIDQKYMEITLSNAQVVHIEEPFKFDAFNMAGMISIEGPTTVTHHQAVESVEEIYEFIKTYLDRSLHDVLMANGQRIADNALEELVRTIPDCAEDIHRVAIDCLVEILQERHRQLTYGYGGI